MNFDLFKDHLKVNIGKVNLNAQQTMAPFVIGDRNQILASNPNPRLGGVMILVYPKNDTPFISLIKRPIYDGVHSGQIALPGGAKDETDKDLKETSLRELKEEIGINPADVKVVGKISSVYIPPSKFLVTPFVGVMDRVPTFEKDDFEVAEIIEVPLSVLFDDAIVKYGKVDLGRGNLQIEAPYFDIFGHKVWGATAIMLSEFKAIMQ